MRSLYFFVAGLTLFGHGVASAQANGIPVTVVSMPASSQDKTITIKRQAGDKGRDLLMLPADAGAGDLLRGLAFLTRVREMFGDKPARAATVRVPPRPNAMPSTSKAQWAKANNTMAKLHRQQPQQLDGVGLVASVGVSLPPSRKRR